MFFGGGGRGGRGRGPARGKNVVHQLKVSLEDMYNGVVRKLSLQKSVLCPKCDGKREYTYIFTLFHCITFVYQSCIGLIFLLYFVGYGGKKGSVQSCGNCRGTGMQVRIQQIAPGMMQQIQSVCAECRGEGESISARDRCKNCNGKKTIREKKIIEVHIDKGMSVYIMFFTITKNGFINDHRLLINRDIEMFS